ncbi:MAG: (2Fe-2S)-binding protein [Desulfobacterales bacterium]|nr:(2Fe-2S)-binding protein [Desulfobacterales bacterium]
MEKRLIELSVNGEVHEIAVKPNDTLLDVLRNTLHLVGTKEGCSLGECGACTVLMDGKPILACLCLATDAAGHQITTIEGLSDGDALSPLQESFVNHGAVQCGFCTPGMILTAQALLDTEERPSADRIKEAIAGNFCRCTGYTKIIEAIQAVGRS